MQKLFGLEILVVTLLVIYAFPMKAKPGIGTSHYNPDVTLNLGTDQQKIVVGRIYNIGNETLKATSVWCQTGGSVELDVHVEPETKIFKPEQSFQINIIVSNINETCIGNYTGYVEVTCETTTSSKQGNPVVAASTLPVKITIAREKPPLQQPEQQNQSQTYPFPNCLCRQCPHKNQCY